MKNRLPGRAKKLSRKWQYVRSPCTNRHHDDVARDPFFVLKENSFHTIAIFIQLREPGAFAHFDAERFDALDKLRNHTTALRIPSFQLKNAIRIEFPVPSRKAFPS